MYKYLHMHIYIYIYVYIFIYVIDIYECISTICTLSCISSAMNGRIYYCSKTTISDMNCKSFKKRLRRMYFVKENMKYSQKT